MDLRNRLLKLAHDNPPLRRVLLPLLREADTSLTGKAFENDDIRYHVYRSSVRVWDLTNAGKRGKKVDYFALYDIDMVRDPELSKKVEQWAFRLRTMNYRQALRAAQELAFEGGDYPPKISQQQEKGVRITPAGFKPLRVRGRGVLVESEWDSFRVRDLLDTNNDPTCIPAFKGGKKDVKVFYRWVRDNESAIKRMDFRQVLKHMDQNNIRYHYYCAMD